MTEKTDNFDNNFDHKILSLYILFGFFILLGYYIMFSKFKKDELWTNQNKNIISKYPKFKYVYLCMILFSFISGIYLIYYFTTTNFSETEKILIYVGSVLFLAYSLTWAFFPFSNSKTVLGFVTIGAILMLTGICINYDTNTDDTIGPIKVIAITASSIILLQTGFFDFVIWNGLI